MVLHTKRCQMRSLRIRSGRSPWFRARRPATGRVASAAGAGQRPPPSNPGPWPFVHRLPPRTAARVRGFRNGRAYCPGPSVWVGFEVWVPLVAPVGGGGCGAAAEVRNCSRRRLRVLRAMCQAIHAYPHPGISYNTVVAAQARFDSACRATMLTLHRSEPPTQLLRPSGPRTHACTAQP